MGTDRAIILLEQVAGYLLVRAGCHTSPTDLPKLARHLGVSSVDDREMTPEGFVESDGAGGFRIALRKDRPHTRRRFSLAHEIGHVILSKLEGKPSSQLGRQYRDSCTVSPVFDEEAQADYLASMLLLPSSLMVPRLASGFSIVSAHQLAKSAQVSIATVLIRSMSFVSQPMLAFHLRAYDGQFTELRCMWTRSSPSAPRVEPESLGSFVNLRSLGLALEMESTEFVRFDQTVGPVSRLEFQRRKFEDRELIYGLAWLRESSSRKFAGTTW